MTPAAIAAVSAGAAVAVFSVALTVGANVLYSIAFARKPKTFLRSDPEFASDTDCGDTVLDCWATERNWFAASGAQRVSLESEDGIPLSAWYLKAPRESKNTVILVHGYSGKGADMAAFARFYLEKVGFDVLMPDMRGHGESGGTFIGFGWPDRRDLVKWAKMIAERNGPGASIMLHGVSMGASAVMMAAGEEDLSPAVKFAVEDCGYTSVEDILRHQLKRMYGLPAFPMLNAAEKLAERKIGFSVRDASAVAQLRKTRIPFLFVHGKVDDFVPFAMERILYDACPTEKTIMEIEGGKHSDSFWVAPDAYRDALIHAVSAYFPER
ncbi:MAG: alpha/beta hydrolase [Rectinemataceae bacterium]